MHLVQKLKLCYYKIKPITLLFEHRTPSPEQLHILLARARCEGMDPTVIQRLEVILYFSEHHHSISETCLHFGISRSTFHRWMERFDSNNLSTLADKSCEPLNLRQSAIDSQTIELIRRYRIRSPQMGKERISELLLRDHNKALSTSSVGRIIDRECLYFAETPLHWKKRMAHQQLSGAQPTSLDAEPQEVVSVPVMPEEVSSPPLSHVSSRPHLGWRAIKRFLIVSSLITNIAFVSILFAMAFFETPTTDVPMRPPYIEYEQQEVLHAAPPQVYIP